MSGFYTDATPCWKWFKYPANIFMFKVNNRNTGKKYEKCSQLQLDRSGGVIVNFEHISHLFLVLLLNLNK